MDKVSEKIETNARGDHLTVRALANMLNVNINIIPTVNPDMEPIQPNDGNSVGTINLGLIQQFHYIAFIPTEPVHPEEK